ncbi:TPA: O-antigen ligase RfaL [Escherichia coli]|jgi:O-antigen ligase|uniref:Lipid A-core:surface polymer ligase n=6 Tax=Escherichia coli TaxID=562 RepID=A0A2X7FNF9_ECOLX|nr:MULTISPECIES: O-antigen ligase RfaL [Enterobacteriaceae]EEW0948797.1 O-antigen ligase RfaL [Escherichia coli]EEY6174777.1 O-antigen ligase RfaL [Escherichia coli]EFB2364388.1 O-antigen ligase RfaL [Escherichia coli]EFB5456380.1 O-antigen ligase RfaL [Escherichia coli]EFB6865552.1 O-antigen ligase RfaL [Escherichia coli]
MTSTLFFSLEKKNWIAYWNRALVFLFITTYFLGGITRYKHLIVILMTITTIVYLCKRPKHYLSLFKTFLFGSVAILTIAALLSLLQSPDAGASMKEIFKAIIENTLLCTIAIPVILRDEKREDVEKIVFFSFISALGLRCFSELIAYYKDYQQGIMPFADYRHRSISDSMVFLFPALLNLWLIKSAKYRISFVVLSVIFIFLILGTLSRGAWLSVLVIGLIWILMFKQWKLLLVGVMVSIIALSVIFTHKEMTAKLTYKLQQTNSSYRYANGTQGSALDLILENPVIGYGYGNVAYKDVYNKRVIDYPEWTFRQSIGPHNFALFIWFGTGLLGLVSLMMLYCAILKECIKNGVKNKYRSPYNAYYIILLSFIGYFVIRGNVEQIEPNLLGVYAGLLLAMKNK